MTRHLVGIIILGLSGFASQPSFAQTSVSVRVVTPAQVSSRPSTDAEALATADPGTVLDVIDADNDWYLVSLSHDPNGEKRRGWVPARDVQAIPDTEIIRELKQEIEQLQERILAMDPNAHPEATRHEPAAPPKRD